jgi:hypothetical protein
MQMYLTFSAASLNAPRIVVINLTKVKSIEFFHEKNGIRIDGSNYYDVKDSHKVYDTMIKLFEDAPVTVSNEVCDDN